MGLWDAKAGDDSRAGWGQEGERHPGITHLSAILQGPGEAGLGMEAEPRQLFRMLPFGIPLLHSTVAPLLSRMLPGFWGLLVDVGTKRGPLAPGQGAGEQRKACRKGSPHWMPGGVLGKKSSCSAYTMELGQESSHTASHWAALSGC